jgi:hypothetical protein
VQDSLKKINKAKVVWYPPNKQGPEFKPQYHLQNIDVIFDISCVLILS